MDEQTPTPPPEDASAAGAPADTPADAPEGFLTDAPAGTAEGDTDSTHAGDEVRPVPVDLRDWVRFSDDEATRVRVLWTPRLALDVWCIQPHQATPVLHEPDRDIAYTVVGGRSWFVTDEGEIGLDPMGALLVPAGVVHGIDNRAPDPLIVLAAMSPPGEARPGDPVSDESLAIRDDPTGPGLLSRAWQTILGRRG